MGSSSRSPCILRAQVKMLSSGEAGNVAQEISRRLVANGCWWEMCEEFAKDSVQWTMEVCKPSQRSLPRTEMSTASGICVAFRSIVPW